MRIEHHSLVLCHRRLVNLSDERSAHGDVTRGLDSRRDPSRVDSVRDLTNFVFFNLISDSFYLLIPLEQIENAKA